jgi:hypothetical protein
MAGHLADDPQVRGCANARRPVLTALLLTAVACLAITAPGEAPAAGLPADHGPINSHNGNGRNNANFSAVNSPTNMSGTQQVAVSISRRTNTQLAFCKRRTRNCTIVQNISRPR